MNEVNKEHEGKRCLIRKKWSGTGLAETEILEVSPSGDYFRRTTPNGSSWAECRDWTVIEVLNDKSKFDIEAF